MVQPVEPAEPVVGDVDRELMALVVESNAQMLAESLRGTGDRADREALAALAAIRGLTVAVDDVLRALVHQARSQGHTWAQIGGVLGVTRQAVIQRFAKDRADPPSLAAPFHAAHPVAEAATRAPAVLEHFMAERYGDVRAGFDDRMDQACSVELLASVRGRLRSVLGALVQMAPAIVRVRQGYTVADVPLDFERGVRTGRVTFSPAGEVAGFFVLDPQVAPPTPADGNLPTTTSRRGEPPCPP